MINDHNKNSWCVNAFHGMSANNDGSTKMCCMIRSNYNDMPAAENIYYVGLNSIKKNFDNSISAAIRQNLDQGVRDSACQNCWDEEDGGRKSKRMRDNERYIRELELGLRKPYTGLAKLELNLGNNCNIKCRTCGPAISSPWIRETFDVGTYKNITFKTFAEGFKKYHQHYDDDSVFWTDLEQNLDTIKQFDFYGGEPFLSNKMWDILRICVERGYAQDIELHYNTNGTVWPKQIQELWPHFREVNVSFSIDGVGEVFEYMRYPAVWANVIENLNLARQYRDEFKNISLSWCVTLSSLNIYNLPETVAAYYESYRDFGIYLNLVHGPRHFNIGKMPDYTKQKVKEKLQTIPTDYQEIQYQLPGIIGFMTNGSYDAETWHAFKRIVKTHDAYRKQDFNQTFSEYSQYV